MKSTYDTLGTFRPCSAAGWTHLELILEHRLEEMNVSVSLPLPRVLSRAKDCFAPSACKTVHRGRRTLTFGLPFLVLLYRHAGDGGSLDDAALDVERVDPEPAQCRIGARTFGERPALPDAAGRRAPEHLGALVDVRHTLDGNMEDEGGPERAMGCIASPHTADLHAPAVPVGRLRELRHDVDVVVGVVDDVHPACAHVVVGPAVGDAIVLLTGVAQAW